MKQLIEYIEEMYSKDGILEVIINKSNQLLEKEKEQIMNAFYADDDTEKCKYEDSEDYYNQTYNQNK